MDQKPLDQTRCAGCAARWRIEREREREREHTLFNKRVGGGALPIRLYTGGANLTYSSNFNEEFCFRMTGPAVEQVLGKLAVQRQKGKAWKGS